MRKPKVLDEHDGNGEVTFVMFQVKGSNETLQKGFNAMEQAFEKLASPGRTFVIRETPKLTEAPIETLVDSENSGSEEHSNVNGSEAAQEIAQSARPERSSTRVPVTPEVLNNLDLDSGEISLKDFAAQKKPKDQSERYLVVAGWFQKYRSVEAITPSHIWTCFPILDWKCANDVGQGFRNAKKTKQWFANGAGKNQWTVTIIGLNYLTDMCRE